MIASRSCWRRALQQSVPSYLRRMSQAHAEQTPSPPVQYPGCLQVPPLAVKEDILRQNGVPGLYQPQSFAVAWYDYQDWCVKNINERIAGTTFSSQTPQNILLQTARNPEQAALFNYASMAWNNQFYFNGISLTGDRISMSAAMESRLIQSFSSVETLKAQLLETAYSMFGPGFVWLVRTNTRNSRETRQFYILSTYLAGSPLAGAHNRLQPIDLNTENIATAGGFDAKDLARRRVANSVSSFGQYSEASKNQKTSYGGIDITPVLCVNTWQHAWMFDWSINGKWQFLNAWWDRIDWFKVQTIADVKEGESSPLDIYSR